MDNGSSSYRQSQHSVDSSGHLLGKVSASVVVNDVTCVLLVNNHFCWEKFRVAF
jgi:hypothetical protein